MVMVDESGAESGVDSMGHGGMMPKMMSDTVIHRAFVCFEDQFHPMFLGILYTGERQCMIGEEQSSVFGKDFSVVLFNHPTMPLMKEQDPRPGYFPSHVCVSHSMVCSAIVLSSVCTIGLLVSN